MTPDEFKQITENITNIVVGGTDTGDIFALAKILHDVDEAKSKPMLTVFPTDLFLELFDDGDFENNMTKFRELQNKHFEALFSEYAAWKVLQQDAKRIKR